MFMVGLAMRRTEFGRVGSGQESGLIVCVKGFPRLLSTLGLIWN